MINYRQGFHRAELGRRSLWPFSGALNLNPNRGAQAGPKPNSLTGLSASFSSQQAPLTWVAPASGVKTYNVYRASSLTGVWTPVQRKITGTSYTVTGLTNGTTYYFVVSASYADGTEGPASGAISFVPNAQASANFTNSSGGTQAVQISSYQSPTPASVCCWFKAAAFQGSILAVKAFGFNALIPQSFIFYWSSGGIVNVTYCSNNAFNDSFTAQKTGLTTGVWYHVGFSMTSTTFTAYFNGTSIGLINQGMIWSGQPMYVGNASSIAAGTPNNGCNGQVADVRMYNVALQGSDFASLYNSGHDTYQNGISGLVGWWKLLDGTGTTALESSGGAGNGTLINGAGWSASAPI